MMLIESDRAFGYVNDQIGSTKIYTFCDTYNFREIDLSGCNGI